MRRWIRNLTDLFFPRRCFLCDRTLEPWEVKQGIHKACLADLYPVGKTVCVHCGMPVSGSVEYCENCLGKSSFLTQGKALFRYKGKIKHTMYRFKYSNKREYACAFADIAQTEYTDWIKGHQIDAIIPVPMYSKKKRARGYNQAECFAEELGERFNIPVQKSLLYRAVDTNPMKTLSKEQRYNNLKNAFQIRSSMVRYGKNALIVDDIYTSGATVEAVSNLLLLSGYQKVCFLGICIGKGF